MTLPNQPDEEYNESAIRRVQDQIAQEPTGGFDNPGPASSNGSGPERPGTILAGRYKLLENIGEGGMGSVWVADQLQPVKRRVAIKLIKAGMDSKQVLARFEAERQALAVMDHPNIAKVFDGGMTESGRPYFVMEYVKGVPFTDYCNQARLPLDERLKLFIPVCQAVQHAHHKGIVHRDLKPSNILICLYDGHPIPKVIDFGLAKAMHQALTDKSIYTGHGMMIGTPMYMSPEQAELNNLDIDTRTDVYSLGVVLYEVLIGTTPLERLQLQQAAYDEILRLIKEVEPPRPSIRLSASASLPSIAAQRSIDPRELRRSLAGELDWIVMKSLEKERSRRYESATALSHDIQRYLNEESVEACPPSRTYQLKKFVKKHKGKVIAASVLMGSLLIGLFGTSWGMLRAIKAERAAMLSEGKTLEALRQVKQERDATEKQRELAERQLCNGILRPIGIGDDLQDVELRCFVDWSAIPDSRLKLKVLEVAFEDVETALQVARRSERSIQAAIGISQRRRSEAIKFLSAKQRDTTAAPQIRVAACWLAVELNSTDLPAFEESMHFLFSRTGHFLSGRPRVGRTDFSRFVELTTTRSQPSTGDQLTLTRGWKTLMSIVEQSTEEHAFYEAINGLVALAPKLNADQVTHSWDKLITTLKKSTGDYVPAAAGDLLVVLASKLNADQKSQSWDTLINILDKSTDDYVLNAACKGLVALAPKLNADQVTHSWDTLITTLEKSTGNYAQNALGDGLLILAPKLNTDQIVHAWDTLITILKKSNKNRIIEAAMDCLVAIAPNLDADQITHRWDSLITTLEISSNNSALRTAGNGIRALGPKLNAHQVTYSWDTLITILEKSTNDDVLIAAYGGLVALAPKLNADQVTHSWDKLITTLKKSTGDYVPAAGDLLVVLASKLNADQKSQSWDTLINILNKSTDDYVLNAACKGLVALAPKLNADQVTLSWDTLITTLEKSTKHYIQKAAGDGLLILAPELDAYQISHCWDNLITLLEKSTDVDVLNAACEVLVALAPKLNADEVSHNWDKLITLLEKSTDDDVLNAACEVLVVLAPKLNADQVSHSWDRLATIIEESPNRDKLDEEDFAPDSTALRLGNFVSVMKLFDKDNSESVFQRAATKVLDLAAMISYFSFDFMSATIVDYSSAGSAIYAIRNPESLAKLLSHPSCVGEIRGFMLQRLEELLFHDGKPVFQVTDESRVESTLSDTSMPEISARRFNSLHDASAWISQNWPDFDQESTHPVTWYPTEKN